jgi:hypothetical protein
MSHNVGLTDEQIEWAAKTIYQNNPMFGKIDYAWEKVREDEKAKYRTLAITVSDFLQKPWNLISQNECIEWPIIRAGNFFDTINKWIANRNKERVFTAVDPRVEKLREFLLHNDRRPETLSQTARGIIALLDEEK